jgi:hypothetical protein
LSLAKVVITTLMIGLANRLVMARVPVPIAG